MRCKWSKSVVLSNHSKCSYKYSFVRDNILYTTLYMTDTFTSCSFQVYNRHFCWMVLSLLDHCCHLYRSRDICLRSFIVPNRFSKIPPIDHWYLTGSFSLPTWLPTFNLQLIFIVIYFPFFSALDVCVYAYIHIYIYILKYI